jgi:hypothetical protein
LFIGRGGWRGFGLVEGRKFGLGGEAFALGFGEPLGDELGVSAGFGRRSVPLDLHVGGDASAGRLGSLVDAGIGGGTVEEVGECVLDVVGVEQLREPAVDVADDLVLAQVGVAGMLGLEFFVAGVLGRVGEAAEVVGAVVTPGGFEALAAAGTGDEPTRHARAGCGAASLDRRVPARVEPLLHVGEGHGVDERLLCRLG